MSCVLCMSRNCNWFLGNSYSGSFSIGLCDSGCNFQAVFEALVYSCFFFCAYERSLLVSTLFSKAVIIEMLPLLVWRLSILPKFLYKKKWAVSLIWPERNLWLNHRKTRQDFAFAFSVCTPVCYVFCSCGSWRISEVGHLKYFLLLLWSQIQLYSGVLICIGWPKAINNYSILAYNLFREAGCWIYNKCVQIWPSLAMSYVKK